MERLCRGPEPGSHSAIGSSPRAREGRCVLGWRGCRPWSWGTINASIRSGVLSVSVQVRQVAGLQQRCPAAAKQGPQGQGHLIPLTGGELCVNPSRQGELSSLQAVCPDCQLVLSVCLVASLAGHTLSPACSMPVTSFSRWGCRDHLLLL